MKNCIFHIPYRLDPNAKAAPMLRPRKMIEAFETNGYHVDVISGFSDERAELIKEVKAKILDGVEYEFMYAESSTMPMLLSDPGHMPKHPFSDFGFFKFVKEHGIKIGLFYRDIYWKFPVYKAALPKWKSAPAIACYQYELRQYDKYIDKLYIPSNKFFEYLDMPVFTDRVETLPPGCESLSVNAKTSFEDRDFSEKPLRIFYVGGLSGQYQIKELVLAVNAVEECELTVCCRPDDWEKEKNNLQDVLSDRIHIVHKTNEELEPEYEKADLCSLLFKSDAYMEMAMPYKTFEYLAHMKPIIASKNMAASEFIESNDIGWTIDYSAEEIKNLLGNIMKNSNALAEKKTNCIKARANNLWTCRAKQVENDLRG